MTSRNALKVAPELRISTGPVGYHVGGLGNRRQINILQVTNHYRATLANGWCPCLRDDHWHGTVQGALACTRNAL